MTKIKFKRTYEYTRQAGRNLYRDNSEQVFGDWLYAKLEKERSFTLGIKRHDIPYKEQLWEIPERKVEYSVELIEKPIENVNASRETHKNDEKGLYEELARYGVMRYYKVYTNETVSKELKVLGYASVYFDTKKNNNEKGVVKFFTYIKDELQDNSCVDADKIKNTVDKLIKEMITL